MAANLFGEIASLTADGEGVNRPAYSEAETRALTRLGDFARGHGLAVDNDAGQNALFSLPEDADADRYVLIGSHADSVPAGGNFDGLAGIVAGLLCLVRALREGIRFHQPVKVIALRGEESAWFGHSQIASKALLGILKGSELRSIHKGDGRTLDEHMNAIGVDMSRVRKNVPLVNLESLFGYIELHIEQGPLLIEKNLPAAAVSGIRGNFRYKKIRCIGEPGHSGAVPREFRKDPVLAIVDLLLRLDENWLAVLQGGGDLVFTCGPLPPIRTNTP